MRCIKICQLSFQDIPIDTWLQLRWRGQWSLRRLRWLWLLQLIAQKLSVVPSAVRKAALMVMGQCQEAPPPMSPGQQWIRPAAGLLALATHLPTCPKRRLSNHWSPDAAAPVDRSAPHREPEILSKLSEQGRLGTPSPVPPDTPSFLPPVFSTNGVYAVYCPQGNVRGSPPTTLHAIGDPTIRETEAVAGNTDCCKVRNCRSLYFIRFKCCCAHVYSHQFIPLLTVISDHEVQQDSVSHHTAAVLSWAEACAYIYR